MSCCRYILSMGKLTVILIGMCVLCGCEGRKNWGEEKWQGLEYPLTATSVNVDRIIFTESDLIFIDDYVIFENWDKDKYYSVFRISQDSLKFIGSFLTKGNGPFEVNASSVHFLNRDSVLMIVAYNPRGKSFVIPVNNLKNVFDFSAWSVVDYPYVESFAYNLLPVTDSTYLMQGFGDSDDLFTLLNTGCRVWGFAIRIAVTRLLVTINLKFIPETCANGLRPDSSFIPVLIRNLSRFLRLEIVRCRTGSDYSIGCRYARNEPMELIKLSIIMNRGINYRLQMRLSTVPILKSIIRTGKSL